VCAEVVQDNISHYCHHVSGPTHLALAAQVMGVSSAASVPHGSVSEAVVVSAGCINHSPPDPTA